MRVGKGLLFVLVIVLTLCLGGLPVWAQDEEETPAPASTLDLAAIEALPVIEVTEAATEEAVIVVTVEPVPDAPQVIQIDMPETQPDAPQVVIVTVPTDESEPVPVDTGGLNTTEWVLIAVVGSLLFVIVFGHRYMTEHHAEEVQAAANATPPWMDQIILENFQSGAAKLRSAVELTPTTIDDDLFDKFEPRMFSALRTWLTGEGLIIVPVSALPATPAGPQNVSSSAAEGVEMGSGAAARAAGFPEPRETPG